MARRRTASDVSHDIVVGGIALLGMTILIGPVIVVLITSLSTSQALKFPPPGLSLQWYEALFDPIQSRQIHIAASNSLKVAIWATVFATVFSVLAAAAIARVRAPSARALEATFMAPLILPALSYGLATLMFFSILGYRPSLFLLTIGHLVVIAPFVFRTTLASLTQLEPALLEGSASLGANRFYTFRRVTLPIIAPGIVAGAFLAFRFAVPDQRPDRYAPDPYVGYDREHAGRARGRHFRHIDRVRLRVDGRPRSPGWLHSACWGIREAQLDMTDRHSITA